MSVQLLRYSDPPTEDVATFLPAEHSIPQRIACFSVSEDRTIQVNDHHALLPFIPPVMGSSIREGLGQFQQESGADPHHNHPNRLDRILRMILDSDVLNSGVFPRPQAVVAFRGVFKKIMMQKSYLALNMCFYQGTIYLEQYDPTPTKLHTDVHVNEFIGKKFETLCTASTLEDLRLHERFYLGATWSLGDMNLYMAGQVDCTLAQDDNKSDTSKYVELKAKKTGDEKVSGADWYLQSQMIGVPIVFIGYHDGKQLKRTEAIKVGDILTAQIQNRYDWLLRVLKSLRAHCLQPSGDAEAAVWRVEVMKNKVKARRIFNSELKRINGRDKRVGILPVWFTEGLKKASTTL
ncbi:hypothetical protein C8J56DRAFT_922457 [Mycena floridula]|nr:hypothetical protein C8J56DRAFT_922457 [Mycena floridula]